MSSKLKRTLALAALMTGATGVANATEGWYGRVDAGYSVDGSFDAERAGYDWSDGGFENDWSQHVGLGYAFANGFRLEGEIGHRFNEIEPTATIDRGGDVHAYTAMANLFYDFNRGGRFEPYVGLGVGMARVNANADDLGPPARTYDDEDSVLAYQGLVGVALGLTERLDLDVGYRYLVANEVEYVADTGDYSHQAVTVGLRWQFAGAAPPPPPPPPPVQQVPPPPPPPPVQAACPTSEFVVYFEWDRSNLNQAALETIDAAVARARQCNVGGVVVVGHTDTSGSPTYNQGLSERRASVVRDALVARGIGAGSVTAQARGESDLARATRDGVREPLNRRTAVTITFR